MNNDLISRQALQDAMYHEAFETDSDMQKWDSGCWIRYKLFENVVEALPSAQPEPQWIPCSESMPHGSCSDLVNVSIHDSGDTPFDYTSCGWVTTDGEYWIVDNEINNHVVAWMPLPEPYKERREEQD